MFVVTDPDAAVAALHPVRSALLSAMRTPTTAAAAARTTGQSRQNAAYHVRALVAAGLLRHAGERRNGTFMEQFYVAAAPTVVISPRAAWGDDHRRADALADQVSLEQLVEHGERLQRDAAVLLDRAAFDGEEIPSASIAVDVSFADEADRTAFLSEYVERVTELAAKYGSRSGDPFRIVTAAYPDPEKGEQTQ